MYTEFIAAVVLTQGMHQAGSDPAQVRCREALLRLRNAEVTEDDWHLFMTRRLSRFVEALDCFLQ